MSERPLEERFRAALGATRAPGDGPWVVAVSGGLDSVVLLHLLRFTTTDRPELVVAHFDHRMRPDSGEDAQWVAGLAEGWGLRAEVGEARGPLGSEAAARAARYEFLEEARAAAGAALVLTGHHADDQAETVLFRAVRGTGQGGLAGMAARRGSLLRPLLGFWRDELEAYARRTRLAWREDATNASVRYARNALRVRVLPEIERLVAPGARRALVRLATLAREDEAGWESVLPALLAPLEVEEAEAYISVDRAALALLHPAVRARILRALVAKLGVRLDEASTRLASDFVASSSAGSSLDLGCGAQLRRELDRMWIGVPDRHAEDRPLTIPDAGPGCGRAVVGGLALTVAWGGADVGGAIGVAAFDPEVLRFPLSVRAREPGDRIRLIGGTKKVKKLLLEARIPRSARSRVPLVVDAEGDVIWVPGVAGATRVFDADPTRNDSLKIGVG